MDEYYDLSEGGHGQFFEIVPGSAHGFHLTPDEISDPVLVFGVYVLYLLVDVGESGHQVRILIAEHEVVQVLVVFQHWHVSIIARIHFII